MLYLFHSSDITLARAKAQALLATLHVKKPDAALVRFDSENVSPPALLELTQTQGLFVQKCIVYLDALSNAEEPDMLWETLDALASSENIFILVEKTPKKDLLTLFEKAATEVREITVRGTRAPARAPENPFAIADVFLEKNSVRLWMAYLRLLGAGLLPESLLGTLFWQVKALLLAKSARSAEEAGLKEFPFSKAKHAAGKFTEAELRAHAEELVTLYHEAHRGAFSLERGLERWCLGVG